ncbi:MAG: OBAP family protein [Halomonas sp.]|nr:OBAP family protein [Halomonas sp.]
MKSKPNIHQRHSPVHPPGESKGTWLAVLEQGASLLQEATPLKGFDVYVVGFHCAKCDPHRQMEAHHYCKVVNDDVLQCVIFDGNTSHANLIGVEYIISEALFDGLPEDEKAYWHPHNYEVFSGELIAPGLPDAAEKAFMKRLVNSYGKTWHTWHTGHHDGDPGDVLPLGDAMLMWSFNRRGECDESLKRNRDRAMDFDVEKKARERQAYLDQAHPQHGVNALAQAFSGTEPVPGVEDADEPARPGESQ